MSVGSAGAINTTLKTILNDGEEVILLAPFFAEYEFYVDNHGGVPRVVPTDADFDPDLTALEAAIGPRTRALILNSPNNPTGRVYGHSTIDGLAQLLDRKQRQLGTTIYLITDEPYRALVYDDMDVPVVATYYRNTILCTSHSKDLGLPGERIGHVAVSPECADAADLVNGMAFAIRTLGFVNAPALMQRIVSQLLDSTVDVDFYRRIATRCTPSCALGFEMQRPQGFSSFSSDADSDDTRCARPAATSHPHRSGSGFALPAIFDLVFVERALEPAAGMGASREGARMQPKVRRADGATRRAQSRIDEEPAPA
jgi:aspartate aminotransferase